jgi:uncharacterized protein (UPF0332 family)
LTPEKEALLAEARQSLEASKLLREEGFYDYPASRAYYSMFYSSQALLLKKGLSFSKHSAVLAALGRYFAKTGEIPPEYHQHLIRAMQTRHTADYDAQKPITQEESWVEVEWAKKFVGLAEDLLSGDVELTSE